MFLLSYTDRQPLCTTVQYWLSMYICSPSHPNRETTIWPCSPCGRGVYNGVCYRGASLTSQSDPPTFLMNNPDVWQARFINRYLAACGLLGSMFFSSLQILPLPESFLSISTAYIDHFDDWPNVRHFKNCGRKSMEGVSQEKNDRVAQCVEASSQSSLTHDEQCVAPFV